MCCTETVLWTETTYFKITQIHYFNLQKTRDILQFILTPAPPLSAALFLVINSNFFPQHKWKRLLIEHCCVKQATVCRPLSSLQLLVMQVAKKKPEIADFKSTWKVCLRFWHSSGCVMSCVSLILRLPEGTQDRIQVLSCLQQIWGLRRSIQEVPGAWGPPGNAPRPQGARGPCRLCQVVLPPGELACVAGH